jgi:hypothetical protein
LQVLTYPLVIASTRDAVKARKKTVKQEAKQADAEETPKTYADAAAEGVEQVKEGVKEAKDDPLPKLKKTFAKALVRKADFSSLQSRMRMDTG